MATPVRGAPSRWRGRVAAVVIGLGIGLAWAHHTGVTVDAGGAPLVVRPQINSDAHTVDVRTAKAGPICARIPSDIELGNIPIALRFTSSPSTEADITAYAALYQDRRAIVDAVLVHYGEWGGVGVLLSVLALGVTRLVFGRQPARCHRLRRAARAVTIAAAGLMGTFPIGLAVVNQIDPGLSHTPGDPMFDGSSLEGSSICGTQLVDKANYDLLATTFDEEFAAHVRTLGVPDDGDVVPVLLRADAHCNLGIQRLDLAIAEAYDVGIYATLGDEFSSGRYLHEPYDQEKICIAPFYRALANAGVELVGVAGNHETPAAVAFMRELGMTVLEGETAEIDGVYFFGYGDPVRSNGTGSVPHDSAEQHALNRDTGDLVGAAACLDRQRRDVVLAHEYPMTLAILERFDACGQTSSFAVAGHTHIGHGPYRLAGGQIFTILDSAGGADKSPKLDWLNRPAVSSVAFVDRQTGELVRLDDVIARPDGSIEIRTTLPAAAPPPDTAVLPELG
jgi:hypothetical protein